MKHGKEWDYKGINHIPSDAEFLPSTVSTNDVRLIVEIVV